MSGVCSKSANQCDSRSFKGVPRSKNKQKFYLDAETADVQFVFTVHSKRKKIPAHKIILADVSDVFHVMFYGKWKKEEEIEIKDISAEALKEFLKFIYCNDVTITKKNVADVMKLADMYEIAESMDICETFMKENMPIEDICSSLQSAIDYNRDELKKFCEERISEQPKAVFASDQFLNCSQNVLKCILEIDSLLCDPKDVFDACIRWAKKTCEKNGRISSMKNLREKLGDCLYLIPFHTMHQHQVKTCVTAFKDLFDRDELVEMIDMIVSDSPVALKKFKSKTPPLAGRWETDYRIRVFSDNGGNKTKYWIKQTEIFTLKMGREVLLRAVKLRSIQHMKLQYNSDKTINNVHLEGTLTITCKNDDSQSEDLLLHKQFVVITCLAFSLQAEKIRLTKPIVLEAKKKYKGQITFGSDWADQIFYIADADLCKNGIVADLTLNFTKR